MIKNFLQKAVLIVLTLLFVTNTYGTLTKGTELKYIINDPIPVKNVPPPVLQSFHELLDVISDENSIEVPFTMFKARWTRTKNEYTVVFESNSENCIEGDLVYVIKAKFKANGELILLNELGYINVRYILLRVACGIRVPF